MKFARRLLILFGLQWLLLCTANCPGGLLVISHGFSTNTIKIGEIPGSTSHSDFCPLSVSLNNAPAVLDFDSSTGLLYWVDPLSPEQEIMYYPINGLASPVSTLLIRGRPGYHIVGMAIDESQRRIFWSEVHEDSHNDKSIWYISLDGVGRNRIQIYQSNTYAGESIRNINIDTKNQVLYYSTTGKMYKANIDIAENMLTNIQEQPLDVTSIELDSTAQKLYVAVACDIWKIDVNDFVSGTLEKLSSIGSCGAINNIQLSFTDEKLYYLDTNKLFEVTLSGVNIVTPTEIISSLVEFGLVYTIAFLTPCPLDNAVTFEASKYVAYEGDANFTITIKRTGSPCLPKAFVRLIAIDGTATRQEDYSLIINGEIQSSGSSDIQFESGKTSNIEVSFEIPSSNSVESNETFSLQLAGASPYAVFHIGQISRVQVTIVDKSSFFQFLKGNYDVMEGVDVLAITIERVGNLEYPARVGLVTTAGTADADVDYDPIIADVIFKSYEHEKSVNITIKDDKNLELTETMQVSFAQTQPEGLHTVLVSIKDNELAFSFKQPSYLVKESIDQLVIPVERIGPTEVEGSVSVRFSVILSDAVNYRAILGEDFAANLAIVLFGVGQSIANIYLEILDDDQIELTESFEITIGDPHPIDAEIIINRAVISILDAEQIVYFVQNFVTVTEGEIPSLRLAIARNFAQEELSVFVSTCEISQSAKAGKDYISIASAEVTFPKEETSVYVPEILIINDSQGEFPESFRVVITNDQMTASCSPTHDPIESFVHILDDDGITYQFSATHYRVNEFTANLKVRIYKNGKNPDNAQLNVYLTALSGSAMKNEDFVFNGPIELNFDSRSYTDVLIQLISDKIYEQDGETFTLQLSDSIGTIIDSATIEIQDDDRPTTPQPGQTYQFSVHFLQILENEVSVKVKVLRSQNVYSSYVTIETISGTANEYNDFQPLKGYTLYFSVGSTLAEKSISIFDDRQPEENEFFQVVLASPSDGGQISGQHLTIKIKDNDIPNEIDESGLSRIYFVGILAGTTAVVAVVFLGSLLICCSLISKFRNRQPNMRGNWGHRTPPFRTRGEIQTQEFHLNNISNHYRYNETFHF